jgi:hypothetical protein
MKATVLLGSVSTTCPFSKTTRILLVLSGEESSTVIFSDESLSLSLVNFTQAAPARRTLYLAGAIAGLNFFRDLRATVD